MNSVLIIDDEPTIRMLLGRILELEGYEVLKAKDRASALGILKKDEVQVVLCDVFLPDGNGVDMVQELQRLTPAAKIILLTAHGNIPDGVQAIRTGLSTISSRATTTLKSFPSSAGPWMLSQRNARRATAVPRHHPARRHPIALTAS